MSNLEERLEANRIATDVLSRASGRCASVWTEPTAPGKWSPAQIVEHVALTLEEGGNVIAGRPTRLPHVPLPLRVVARFLLFRRVLRKGGFPTARTNAEMNPASGPPTAEAGRARLSGAREAFERECRAHAAATGAGVDVPTIRTPFFGRIPLLDFIRFIELHTRHHVKQMPGGVG